MIDDKILRKRFSEGKRSAKRRNIKWEITKQEFDKIIQKSCFYCQNLLYKESTLCVGLDRMDPKKDYTIDNVVPCCWMCNSIKSDFISHEEMIDIANLLIDYRGLNGK